MNAQSWWAEYDRRRAEGCKNMLTFAGVLLLVATVLAIAVGIGFVVSWNSSASTNSEWTTDGHNCVLMNNGFHVMGSYVCNYRQSQAFINADVTVTMKVLKGDTSCAAGVFYRAPSDTAFYAFLVDGKGRWKVENYSDSTTSTDLMPSAANGAIRTGPDASNTLRVVMNASHFDFYVNGTKVGQVDDATYAQGGIGVAGCDSPNVVNSDVLFTGFHVSTI